MVTSSHFLLGPLHSPNLSGSWPKCVPLSQLPSIHNAWQHKTLKKTGLFFQLAWHDRANCRIYYGRYALSLPFMKTVQKIRGHQNGSHKEIAHNAFTRFTNLLSLSKDDDDYQYPGRGVLSCVHRHDKYPPSTNQNDTYVKKNQAFPRGVGRRDKSFNLMATKGKDVQLRSTWCFHEMCAHTITISNWQETADARSCAECTYVIAQD